MTKQPNYRRANGTGCVSRMSGNRRRPFVVLITSGYTAEGKQQRVCLGRFLTRDEANHFLYTYNQNPEDFNNQSITVNDVWESMYIKLKTEVENGEMSASNLKNLLSAYKYCFSIKDIPFIQLTHKTIQKIINDCPCGHTTQGYLKNLFKKLFYEAKMEYNLKVDFDLPNSLKIKKKEKVQEVVVFTEEEISKLWDFQQVCQDKDISDIVEIVLIMIYTGLRPQELIDIELANVHLEDKFMVGGCKTNAGRNRIIPFHRRIEPFIAKRMNNESGYLISVNNRQMDYYYLRYRWEKIQILLNFNHRLYDTRRTMATRLNNFKLEHPDCIINETIIKRIMGHSISDVTQEHYIYTDRSYLIQAVNLLK